MSRKTRKRLDKLANGLEKAAQGIVGGIELVMNDLTAGKRVRKVSRR